MVDTRKIHDFADKWFDKFRDQNINYIELVDHFMADDCATLGFEMDCGKAFETKYGKAVFDDRELAKVIDAVVDINLLGSAIYSRWRYFNHYKITVDYKKNLQQVITGTFDKNGLPNDYGEFADAIFDFMRFYGLGEILDPSVYEKAKRRHGDNIFCSVAFEEGSKSYYYLTDDDSIEIGDSVIVPAGKDNHEATVEVVNIEYFSKENAPLPNLID